MFILFNVIIAIVLGLIDNASGLADPSTGWGPLSGLYTLFIILPSLAVGVRRLHDTGKSGWWLLISLIPLLGGIWLLVLLVSDSQGDQNEYGPNPKAVAA